MSQFKRIPSLRLLSLSGAVLFLLSALLIFPSLAQTQEGSNLTELVFIPFIRSEPVLGTTYYVSPNGNNLNGQTWDSAWNELDQIDWSVIEPGDTILIDGGPFEMQYETTLEFGASGEAGRPIRIQLAEESGRNGKAIFFGGRETPLPYCFQVDYQYDEPNESFGIFTFNQSFVVVDGTKWGGIAIHGYGQHGIRVERDSTDVTFRHIEVYDNGRPVLENGSWFSDQAGVRVGGKNITFERMDVHDNGQDAFQSLFGENNLENLTIRQSWLHNARKYPTGDEAFNFCTHTDGMQIYDGGLVTGITIEESIIGPGFTQGLLLGGRSTSASADVHDVVLRNVLAVKAADNNIAGYRDSDSQNWVFENVTIHCPNTKGFCIRVDNEGHQVTNSIIYDGRIEFPNGITEFSGNCLWDTKGDLIGETIDPQFSDIATDPFSLDNYALSSTSPCEGSGSSITSVEQLMNLTRN